jgi:hypothetical protein
MKTNSRDFELPAVSEAYYKSRSGGGRNLAQAFNGKAGRSSARAKKAG